MVELAVKVTAVPEQMVLADAVIATVGVTLGVTCIVIALDVAVALLIQVALEVTTQRITLPLARAPGLKVALLAPDWLTLLMLHWYPGADPALVAVAVNVTGTPAQTELDAVAIVIVGETLALTVITKLFEVAVVAVAQLALVVNTHVTVALLAKVELVKVALFVPTFEPLTFHWYTGLEPPLLAVAVKVTDVPAQIDVAEAAIDTVGVTAVPTVIVIGVAVAVAMVGQAALEVITTVIISPEAKLVLV